MPSLPKSALSDDARHLLNRAEAGRDRVVFASVSAGSLGVFAANAVVHNLGSLPVAAAIIGVMGAGVVALRSYSSLRATDQRVVEMAETMNREAPARQKNGLLGASQLAEIVSLADQVAPDLVKSIANRRVRRWEAALQADYVPPSRNRPTPSV